MSDSMFGGVVQTLQNMGFFDVILPFLLIFAVIYGVLARAQIFEDRNDINAVIAFVMGMLVIGSSWVVGVLTGFLPIVGLLSVVFLGGFILFAMFAGNAENIYDGKAKYVAAAVILVVFPLILVNMIAPTFWGDMTNDWALPFSMVDMGVMVAMVLVIGIMIWITKPSGGDGGGSSSD